MRKYIAQLIILFALFYCDVIFAQIKLPFIHSQINSVNDFWADDYGGLYFLNKENLSFTKYDSLGNKNGELLWAVPFHVQNVNNPLTIALFSENAQEIRFIDQNLNYIQNSIQLQNLFSYVKAVYIEDLQFAWILDDVQKSLVKYDYRSNVIVKSYVFNIDLEGLNNFIVYRNKMYICKKNSFDIYDLNQNQLQYTEFEDLRKIDREGNNFYLFFSNKILKYNKDNQSIPIFSKMDARLVTKNFKNFFAIEGGNLYLYTNNK